MNPNLLLELLRNLRSPRRQVGFRNRRSALNPHTQSQRMLVLT